MKKLEKQLIKAQRRLDKLKEQAEKLKEDPYKELKEAYKQGKTIQLKTRYEGWRDLPSPYWNNDVRYYRIKPEEVKEPKVGDICKFWDYDKESFSIGKLASICGGLYYKYLNINNEKYYINCEPLYLDMTLAEVFGKEGNNE